MTYTAKGRAQVRACPALQRDEVMRAIAHLRDARDCLKLAGAPRTLARVRAALRSADGALRHASNAPFRTARRERRAA